VLHPGYVEPDSPYLMLAQAQDELGFRDLAIAALDTFRMKGGYDPGALRRSSEWLLEAGRLSDAIDALRLVTLVQPLDSDLHESLGELLMQAGDAGEALQEFEIALARNPHDRAMAHYRVAQAQRKIGDTAEARSNLLMALDIAPAFRPAQKLLLELSRSE
jgi:tetratricopeptide (TPR) repeat protein